MSILPLLGTTYKSLDAFKLDVQQRAVIHSLRFSALASIKDKRLRMNCSGTSLVESESHCSCRAIVNKNPEGIFAITVVNNKHSCSNGQLERGTDIDSMNQVQNSTTAASEDSGEKDAGYSDGGRASCKRQKRVSYVGDDEASDGSYSQDSLTSDSDADVPSSSTTSKVVKVKAGPSGIGRSLVSASRRMPSARELLFEIVNLKTNTLSLPLPTETFSEPPHQLLATLYAYAQQNGFRLQRSTKADVKTSLKMCCGSKARDLEQRCPYSISARRDQDVWRILPLTTTQHNHTLSSSSALPSSLTTAAPAATSTSSLSQTQNLSNLPSYATRSSHSQPFVVLSTYQPLLPPRFESPISTQNASSLDLASLLRPFHSSPFEVQRSFDYLHSIKVDSVETLTQLLMIEDEGFERLVKGIENEIGKKLRTMREDLHEELAK